MRNRTCDETWAEAEEVMDEDWPPREPEAVERLPWIRLTASLLLFWINRRTQTLSHTPSVGIRHIGMLAESVSRQSVKAAE